MTHIDASPERIIAPWTDAQVQLLRWWQTSGAFHPYTCPGDGHGALIPFSDGWHCPDCTYTQTWAHPFTLQDYLAIENGDV